MTPGPQPSVSRAGSLPLVGGAAAFDFCNTSSGRGTERHLDHLKAVPDLLVWSRHAGHLDDAAHSSLSRRCEIDGVFGPALLARALDLRTTLYDIGAALAHGRPPHQPSVDALATAYAGCLGNGRLAATPNAYRWAWDASEAPEEVILGPLAASALFLLTEVDRSRIKQCPGDHCGWLFLDHSKNRSRRWCEMEVCGNRAKQRRHQGRPRGATEP